MNEKSLKRKSPQVTGALPHFIGYLRVSKERDTTGSFTFETQRDRINQSLDLRYGKGNYEISFLEDDGMSGGYGLTATGMQSKVRPTLRKIADLIQTGDYKGVIVYGQNRFFRNARALMEMVQDVLLVHDAQLLSATEDLDIETSDGRMMMYMKALFDEKQREDIIKRNKDAAATRAEQGYAIGQVGYGWMWDPNHNPSSRERRLVMPVEEEKHWLMHIKDRYLSGWNTYRITSELNELDVPSPMRRELWSAKAEKQRAKTGRIPKWTNGTVWDVLKNPLHAGLIQLRDGTRIQGKHWEHRFWDPEVLEQIESQHALRVTRFKTCTGQKEGSHLLNGIIHCARCGKRLYLSSTSETTKNYRSYKCFNGRNEGKQTCPDVVVRAEWVEDAVVDVISKITQNAEMRQILHAEARDAATRQDCDFLRERAQLKRKLSEIEEKFDRWADGYSRGIMTPEQFQKYSVKLQLEEQEAKERLQQIEKDLANRTQREQWVEHVKQQFEAFPLVWNELDSDEKRQVLILLLEEGGLTANRDGRDIKLQIKPQLLPVQERTIAYRTYRGINRTSATGLQRLTLRQMVMLYYAGQGKTRREAAELMGCKVNSLHTIEKTIRNNLGVVTWEEAVEMTRERVQANLHQLPLGKSSITQEARVNTGQQKFLSPVLMEVFELFAKGATVPEVADRLQLSVTTVQGRRARILKSFGTSSMLEAVETARTQLMLP